MTSSQFELFRYNTLLAVFSDEDLERLLPHFKPLLLHDGHVLFENNIEHDFVYFPKSGLISVVLTSKTKTDVEIGIVGREGAANLIPVLSEKATVGTANVQIAGSGWRMAGANVRAEFAHNAAFREAVFKYLHFWSGHTAQSVLCNRLHTIEQRLSRWLLQTQDRTQTEVLEITHEFLATMLGTGRVGVTLAAKSLRESGLIDYGRRNVVILDRPALEANACECYAVIRKQLDGIRNMHMNGKANEIH